MPKPLFPCGICHKEVITNVIECSFCECWIHKKCAKLSLNNLRKLNSQAGWWCQNCIMLFIFYDTDNAELIVTHIDTPQNNQLHNADQCIQKHKYEQVEGKSS